MKKLTAAKPPRPVRVLQFGEGNFLRAFADWMIDQANLAGAYNGSVAVVQPTSAPTSPAFREQDCLYTVLLRGKEKGETINRPYVVASVAEMLSAYADYSRWMAYAGLDTLEAVISNTTEAGIVLDETDRFEGEPPASYPGKLTKFLYERYRIFRGAPDRGLVIFPVELIEDNGGKLKDCVLRLARLWGLGEGFTGWLESACMFCSTLVDRIVTGYPKKPGEAEETWAALGYEDRLLDICEPFALWVIEAPDIERAHRALPLDKAGLPVIFTSDQRPYRERKVRILNGAHTAFVPAAFLAGQDIVRDCMADKDIRAFIDAAVDREILPTLALPREDAAAFADSVRERFENPFIDHALLSICLNSVSKWKARVLPSLLDSLATTGRLPPCLTLSFAALCEFYSRGRQTETGFAGVREVSGEPQPYPIADDAAVTGFFAENGGKPDIAARFAAREDFWGRDLNGIPGFTEAVSRYLDMIRTSGARSAMAAAVSAAGL